MGIFNRVQKEVEAREQREGITPADLLDLSDSLRRLMNRITRQGELTVGEAAEYIGETPESAQQVLTALLEKGYLEREERGGEWVYRTRFARTQAHNLPVGLWSALGKRAKEE